MRTADIRNMFIHKYKQQDFFEGVPTLELLGVSFIADEEAIFGQPNYDYIRREIDWYNFQSLCIHHMEAPIPEIWKQIADKFGFINSNYGWCIYSNANGNQYKKAVDALVRDKNTRQAMMIYTAPDMHERAVESGRKDFMCTNTVQVLIRDDELHLVVNMRSNDAVFGYKNDYAWHKHVQLKLFNDLRLKYEDLTLGNVYWQVGSLHIYERHFSLVANHETI